MKILVTGSAGFIGFHVCRRLLADGHDVAGIDAMVPYYDVRLKEDRLALLAASPRFSNHRLDIADMAATAAALAAERPEVIVHLAAQAGVRYSLDHPESYVASNVVGTFNLLEICRHRPVRHFLMASTSSAYGGTTRMPFREIDAATTPLTIYAATKLSAEAIAHSYAHLWNQPATTFRFFTVYGPWGRPDMAPTLFASAIRAGRRLPLYNAGRNRRDFTYVDDIVDGVVKVLLYPPAVPPRPPLRLYNLGHNRPVETLLFVRMLEELLGRKAEVDLLPPQPGEMLETCADLTRIQAEVGFTPKVPLEEGLRRFVDWFRTYYPPDAG